MFRSVFVLVLLLSIALVAVSRAQATTGRDNNLVLIGQGETFYKATDPDGHKCRKVSNLVTHVVTDGVANGGFIDFGLPHGRLVVNFRLLKGDPIFACQKYIIEFDAKGSISGPNINVRVYCEPRPLSKQIYLNLGRQCVEDYNPKLGCHLPEVLEKIDEGSRTDFVEHYISDYKCTRETHPRREEFEKEEQEKQAKAGRSKGNNSGEKWPGDAN